MPRGDKYRCHECQQLVPRAQFSSHPQVCSQTIKLDLSENEQNKQIDILTEISYSHTQAFQKCNLEIDINIINKIHGIVEIVSPNGADEIANEKEQLPYVGFDDLNVGNSQVQNIFETSNNAVYCKDKIKEAIYHRKNHDKSIRVKRRTQKYHNFKREGNSFTCTLCNLECETRGKYMRHTDQNHRIIPCDECGQKLPWKCDTCANHKHRVCHLCFKICNDKIQLKVHSKSHDKSLRVKRRTQRYHNFKREGESFTCTLCNLKFETRGKYMRHTDQNHRDIPCDECGIKFPWKCDSCSKHNKKACHVCFKIFDGSMLTDHLNRHLGLKPFLCDECPKDFRSQANLSVHLRLKHTSVSLENMAIQKNPCDECGKLFSNDYKICTLHTKATLRTKPCGECGKLFSKRYKNCTIHTQARYKLSVEDLPCERGCGYTTKWFYQLKIHYHSKRCDPDKPLLRIFFCGFCESSFTTAKYKRRHERFHNEGKPHTCKICDKQFTESWNMKKHIRIAHSLNTTEYENRVQ